VKRTSLLFCLVFLAIASPLLAAEDLDYNIINLRAEAARQVENDVMVVHMSALAEANSAAEAAESVNDMMKWAAETAGTSEGVKSRTLNYQTRPIYQNKVLIGWSVNQQIRFESKHFATLSALVGILQEKLRVESMQFEISPDRRAGVEHELITAALDAFREKAGLVSSTLGARDYRIVKLTIQENSPVTPYRRGYQAEAMSVQMSSAPHVEAGDAEVTVRTEGTIQLMY